MRFPLILAAAGLGAAAFMALPAASQQPGRTPPAASSSRRTDAPIAPPALPSPYGAARPEVSVSGDTIVASGCLVTLMGDGDVEVPAQEQGVLMEIPVKEGQVVKKDDTLGQIDDSQAKMAMEVARNQWLSAQAEADNEVSILYARAAFAVAQAEVQQALEANGQQPNTFSRSEVLERQLKARQYELQIQQAQHEKKVNGHKADEKHAELDAAALEVTRRHIKSPLDGIVVKRFRHAGEWVKPGDPVVRLIRADRLRIEGMLSATASDPNHVLPSEIINQPVTVTLAMPNGKQANFHGSVVFANPIVEAGMQFLVHAEVENRQENGFWLLRPGLIVKMTIQRKR
jgi:multidrug efflux pump subunit AcrA (membrane-fusion protein)